MLDTTFTYDINIPVMSAMYHELEEFIFVLWTQLELG
jgi:hypothetical protein